jgi:hypothetical protein
MADDQILTRDNTLLSRPTIRDGDATNGDAMITAEITRRAIICTPNRAILSAPT